MTVETIGTRTVLRADEGKGICPKTTKSPVVTSVSLCENDAAENWEDCEIEEMTEADKDAALTKLGVDMTEG